MTTLDSLATKSDVFDSLLKKLRGSKKNTAVMTSDPKVKPESLGLLRVRNEAAYSLVSMIWLLKDVGHIDASTSARLVDEVWELRERLSKDPL